MNARRTGSLYRRGPVWWFDLSVRNKRYRVSTGCVRKEDAEAFRAARLLEVGRGKLAGLKTETTFEDLAKILEDRHQAEGRKGIIKYTLRHLRKAFGHLQAKDITPDRITAYALQRRQAGAAVASVNLELAYLRRAFRVGLEADRVVSIPKIKALPGERVRQGFLDLGVFQAIVAGMPPHMRAVVEFLRLTGWRESEALSLEWRRVDLTAREIRLETSKSGQPRAFSYGGYEAMEALLEGQRKGETRTFLGVVSPFVFPLPNGRRITVRGLQSSWSRARAKVGSLAMIHDLRRTFVRNCEQAGVPRSVAMSLTGHKTHAVYARYAIVAKRDQEEGLQRLQAMPEPRVVVPMKG